MKKTLLIESILVLITGVAITLLKLLEGGMSSVNDMAKGIETNSLVIYGLFAFLSLAIVSRLIRKYFGVSVYHFKEKMQFTEEVLEGVGAGLLGIYRLICGMALTVPFILFFSNEDAFDWARAGLIMMIGAVFFIGLLILSWANDGSKELERHPANKHN